MVIVPNGNEGIDVMGRIAKWLSLSTCCLFAFLQTGCGVCMYKSDPIFVFKGNVSPPMEGVTVYVSRVVLTRSGQIDPEVKKRNAFLTDDSGAFIGRQVGEMDCGKSVQNASDVLYAGASLQVYVDHPGFRIYHDSLGKEELDGLARITFEEAGMVRGEKENGVWVLPDITLQPK